MTSVMIPLADGCEELEAVTLVDLLRRADFHVTTAGLKDGPVTASRKTVLLPDTRLDHLRNDTFDLIVLPGGLAGTNHLAESEILKEMLVAQNQREGWIGAICAAPRVLAIHGLLENRQATAFSGALDEFSQSVGSQSDAPLVVDGHIVTSRGPGTAMDFALKLIELLKGEKCKDRVEAALERPRNHTTRELPVH